ncbi:MAG: hypothetical protein LIO46_03000 [Clostridiales bacterium]|nr:hypothetical protein [Clostridiales bacterium]
MRGWIRLTAAAVFLLAGAGCARDTADSQPTAQEVRTTAPAQEETNTVESIRAVIVTEATTGQTEPEPPTHAVSEPIDIFDETQRTQTTYASVAPWSYQGTVETGYEGDAQRPVYGFDFSVQYDASAKTFTTQAGMGECDKIAFYTLTEQGVKVAVPKAYKLDQWVRSIGGHCQVNLASGDYVGSGLSSVTEDGQYYYCQVNYNRPVAREEIQSLFISFGKVD